MKLFLLGRTEWVADDDRPIPLPTKKVFLLLAILAMNEGRRLSRDVLSETIWPDKDRDDRLVSLRNALSHLRKTSAEPAIFSDKDSITLAPGTLWADAREMVGPEDYSGDFMPGYDHDWVIDERLRLREKALEAALKASGQQKDRAEAIRYARLALSIDPLSQEAAQRQMDLLLDQGHRNEAAKVEDEFQARSLKLLGTVSNLAPESRAKQAANPLEQTAEWLLNRNPSEAIDFLAATGGTWFGGNAMTGLQLHDDALRRAVHTTPAHKIVRAQRIYLKWILGRLDEVDVEAREIFETAIVERENTSAWIAGSALAYSNLSKGKFRESMFYARSVYDLGERSGDTRFRLRSLCDLAIIEQHSGQVDQAKQKAFELYRMAEEYGDAEDVASYGMFAAGFRARAGQENEALRMLDQSRRFYEANQQYRKASFVHFGKAELYTAIGAHREALDILRRIQAHGFAVLGQSLFAAIGDLEASLYSRTREYDSAVESLARSALVRRHLGSKPSLFEQQLTNPTRRLLRERLDDRDIRAAFSRARLSFRQSFA